MLTNSERARLVRAELDAIVAALRVDELSELLVLGRRLLEREEFETFPSSQSDATPVD